MKKHFIITIDTESDNQWDSRSKLTTDNAKFLPRFQDMCENYGFKPVYLTDYSMGSDNYFINFAKECIKRGVCEVGMHPHAWDIPPCYRYDKLEGEKPYLIEYPEEVMYSKLNQLKTILESNFEQDIVSHRAGRWAINERYVQLLGELGIKVDCSVTPGVNWSKQKGVRMGGSDYSKFPINPYIIDKKYDILEVPVSIRKIYKFRNEKSFNIKEIVKNMINFIYGKNIWLRPSISNIEDMKLMIDMLYDEDYRCLEFMMHSSEFMPKGSPYYQNENEINQMYENLEILFKKISLLYDGITLEGFYKEAIYDTKILQ